MRSFALCKALASLYLLIKITLWHTNVNTHYYFRYSITCIIRLVLVLVMQVKHINRQCHAGTSSIYLDVPLMLCGHAMSASLSRSLTGSELQCLKSIKLCCIVLVLCLFGFHAGALRPIGRAGTLFTWVSCGCYVAMLLLFLPSRRCCVASLSSCNAVQSFENWVKVDLV